MYKEEAKFAAPYRQRIVEETAAYIENMRRRCDSLRSDYFIPNLTSPEAYRESVKKYRADFINMLGRPLTEMTDEIPEKAVREPLFEEEDFTCERLWVEVAPGLTSYGLLFIPKAEGKRPYVTALHGGGGTPEIVSSLYPDIGSANYKDLVLRIMKRTKAIMYAPQLMLWNDAYNTDDCQKADHIGTNDRFRQVGGTLASFEIFKIYKTVSWICENLPVDTDKMGIAGLSYGGFYTLMNAACDTRYKAALSSCWFADRYKYTWGDWTFEGQADKFLDPELASLICPRYLCIEVGAKDNLFPGEASAPVAKPVEERYAALGIADKFRFNVHAGDHEFNRADDNLDWFVNKLLG